jgi:hypothetical protein
VPGHGRGRGDPNPSLSVDEGTGGRVLVRCHAGCPQETVLAALRDRGLWPGGNGEAPAQRLGLTVAELAAAKRLPEALLRELGLRDVRLGGQAAVGIPYHDANGDEVAVRYRIALDGDRFRWRKGSHVLLYGLWRLRDYRPCGWVLLVEGESDAWTCWAAGVPALGIPGKSTWRHEWARAVDSLEVFVWQEPQAEDFTARIARDLPHARVIVAPPGIKDLSEAHLRGVDVAALVEELKRTARTAEEVAREVADTELQQLREAAALVLEHPDPLQLVCEAVAAMGYAGDPQPVLVQYLAATTRLLKLRRGQMPAHLLAVGAPSLGKSFSMQTALALLPPEAKHEVDAGSPRVLIYDDADLRHKVLCFAEIDSIPRGEDNPAASAVRNLLQDHALHYKVVIRDPESGDFTVRTVHREGPTVLMSSAVRAVSGQLGTRLFVLPVPDDAERVRGVLQGQARLELEPPADAPRELVAFQAYLQRLAPWDVVVPFAQPLASLIARGPVVPRLQRDFARLLSMIKGAAVLRHRHRRRDSRGRLVAELEDYATVRDLVGDLYEASVTGATETVRKVVQAVREAREEGVARVSYSEVARRLGMHHQQVRRAVEVAERHGWLENQTRGRRGAAADLVPGEPLPDRMGLPTADEVAAAWNPPPPGDGPGPRAPEAVAREWGWGDIPSGEPCASVQVARNSRPDGLGPAQEGVQVGAGGVQVDLPQGGPPPGPAQGLHRPAQGGVQVKGRNDGPSSQPAHLHTPYREMMTHTLQAPAGVPEWDLGEGGPLEEGPWAEAEAPGAQGEPPPVAEVADGAQEDDPALVDEALVETLEREAIRAEPPAWAVGLAQQALPGGTDLQALARAVADLLEPPIAPSAPEPDAQAPRCPACGGRRWWRRPETHGGGWVCARCHPPRGVQPAAWQGPEADPAPQQPAQGPEARAEPALRHFAFERARRAGFPKVMARPGEWVVPGEDGWRTFCARAPLDRVLGALAALCQLDGEVGA